MFKNGIKVALFTCFVSLPLNLFSDIDEQLQKHGSNMFIYTETYIESHRNIQNTNIHHRTHPKHQNTFRFSHFPNISLFSKKKTGVQRHQRFMLNFMALLIFYIFQQQILFRATQPHQFT